MKNVVALALCNTSTKEVNKTEEGEVNTERLNDLQMAGVNINLMPWR